MLTSQAKEKFVLRQWLTLRTLPLIVGVRGNRLIWTGLNLSFLVFLGWLWGSGWNIPGLGIILLVLIVNLTFIWLLGAETPRNTYNIALDGCLFLPALLTKISYIFSTSQFYKYLDLIATLN